INSGCSLVIWASVGSFVRSDPISVVRSFRAVEYDVFASARNLPLNVSDAAAPRRRGSGYTSSGTCTTLPSPALFTNSAQRLGCGTPLTWSSRPAVRCLVGATSRAADNNVRQHINQTNRTLRARYGDIFMAS